nr:hypothetical protein [Polymorphobacter multimanifer]
MEKLSATQCITVDPQPLRDRARAHRFRASSELRHVVDQAHRGGLLIHDKQFLALFLAIGLHRPALVAEYDIAAVEEPAQRIAPSVATSELSCILRIFFVHQADDATHHLPGSIV